MTNQELVVSLARAAAFIGSTEEKYSINVSNYAGVTLTRWFYDTYDYETDTNQNDAAQAMAAARRAMGGQWQKDATDYSFSLTQDIGNDVKIVLSVSRDSACTPKVIGTETVEVKDYDSCPTKTITRDIIEYDCNPILDDKTPHGYRDVNAETIEQRNNVS